MFLSSVLAIRKKEVAEEVVAYGRCTSHVFLA